jgi:hypothetical protein
VVDSGSLSNLLPGGNLQRFLASWILFFTNGDQVITFLLRNLLAKSVPIQIQLRSNTNPIQIQLRSNSDPIQIQFSSLRSLCNIYILNKR